MNENKMMDCELPLGMIHVSLILDHNMSMNYAEEPFIMGMFFYLRRPSKWVNFQTPNTHIRAFLYWSRPPTPGSYDPSGPGLIPRVMDYDEACFMHLTPGVVHNFPKAVGV